MESSGWRGTSPPDGVVSDREGRVFPWPARAARRVTDTILAERERWPLWTPVGLGFGIALYFALPAEPSPWLGVVCGLLVLAVGSLVRERPGWRVVAVAGAIIASGFTVAQLRTAWVAAPVLSEQLRSARVVGRVVENAAHRGGHRLLLDRVEIAGLSRTATPERVRVTVRRVDPAIAPGDWVRLRAGLSPPPGPAAPGAFDFGRSAYFARLGAVGFAMGAVHAVAPPESETESDWRAAIERLRHEVTARLLAGLDGQAGAVAAALLTGERGAIAEDVLAAMRDAGLAHLLAISGLHLGLVGLILFASSRALLALCEPLALRFAIKKWAACVALAGTLFYLALSGATIPTQRAFLMGGLVIVAILLDRTGMSMRSLAWAATVVLLIEPESLLSASFQMSFAAVVALVAVYENFRVRPADAARARGARRVLVYLAGVGLMTLVAGLATAPFAAYHFNRLAAYGLAANLVAVPLTALWIMPWGIAALALMPPGFEAVALAPMGWGIDAVIAVARTVAGWPGAVALVPAMPLWELLLAVVGGLWLCLWRQPWRWFGIAGIVAGLATPALAPRPDVFVDGDGRLLGVRFEDGALALSSTAKARFVGNVWLRRNGQDTPVAWTGDDPRLRCDGAGCIYRARDHVVALVRDPRALADDCRVADIVVATLPVNGPCPSALVLIDLGDLRCHGAHGVFLGGDGVRVEFVAAGRGVRPWTPRRERRC